MQGSQGRWAPLGSPALGTVVAVALVAGVYYLSGRLGLLLAIPPGYATAVWPASGIALAAVLLDGRRALIGVALGSALINLPTGWDGTAAGWAIAVPVAIGLGAALQAAVGAALIGRWVGYRNLLAQEVDAVRLLLIGGPLACLISPSIGVGSLWLSGRLPAEGVAFNWFTWWVGDSIGVLIFATLALIWSVRPYKRWLRQQVFVSVPLAGLFALVVAVFVFISQRENLRIESEFRATAAQIGNHLQDDLRHALTVLSSIEGYHASTGQMHADGFEIFASRLLPTLRGGRGLSWNPRVSASERPQFESADGHNLAIFEKGPDGANRPAGSRPEYVPIAAIVPREGSSVALGYDVYSEPVRREALDRARDTARPAATRRLELVQLPGRSGSIVFVPLYQGGVPGPTVEVRRQNLEGYAAALFDVEELIGRAKKMAGPAAGLALSLVDQTGAMVSVLYQNWPEAEPPVGGLVDDQHFEFAGRQLRLRLQLPERELVARRSWESWLVLAGGLFLAGLAGMLMLLVTGRSVRVESLVAAQTAELRKSEAALQRKASQLVASNTELEQFAYIASHDLKAPLRSIASFAQLVEKRSGSELKPEAREFLAFIRDGVNSMQLLVDDLLRLSRVEAKRLELQSVDLGSVVRQACQSLAADIGASGARVHVGELPTITGDPRMLLQLFQNLLGNAIKFQKRGVVPEAWVSAQVDRDEVSVTVRDNGIGVESRFLDHIFQLFKRLHTPDQYPGTGLGLAICRKVVQLHGGEISAESAPGAGLTVRFTLLREPQG